MSPGPPLPAGYLLERERGVIVAALPSVMEHVRAALREYGTLYEWAAARPDAVAFTGRGATWRIGAGSETWLVRHYRRGGAVARALGDRYFRTGEPRPLRELRASAAVRAAGVPTPDVIAAVVYPAGAVYRGDLATRYVPHSADLAAMTWISAAHEPASRVAAWRAAGTLLRRVFAAGVVHPDLNLRNILIERQATGVAAWLLDLDRARVREPDDVAQRTMLARFHRSRRKLEAQFGTRVDDAALTAFQHALAAEPG